MVLSLQSLYGTTEPAAEDLAGLQNEISTLSEKHERTAVLARRKELVEIIAANQVRDDGNIAALTQAEKQAEKALEVAKAARREAEGKRISQVLASDQAKDAARAELLSSAPLEITQAEAELQKSIDAALVGEHTQWHDIGNEKIRYSNTDSVNAFVPVARAALANVRDLRLKALDAKQLNREIKSILGTVPVAQFPLEETL